MGIDLNGDSAIRPAAIGRGRKEDGKMGDTKMIATMTHARQALSILVILPFMLGIGSSTALSEGNPKEILGFGEAETAPFVTYDELAGGTRDIKSFGKTSLGAIGDTVGNRLTFAFGATEDAEGNVQGQMFLFDHALNLRISSDVAVLVPHPKVGAPAGVKGDTFDFSIRMISSKATVVVNGETRPDWTFINSPVFDGAKDAVCFELKNPDGEKVYQWSAFLSDGDVKVIH